MQPWGRSTVGQSANDGAEAARRSLVGFDAEQRGPSGFHPRPCDRQRIRGICRQLLPLAGIDPHELANHRRHRVLAGRPVPGDAALHPRRRELVHGHARRRRFGQDDPTRFPDPQRRLHALAVERLLHRQFIGSVLRHQGPELLRQRPQSFGQLDAAPTEPQHPHRHQPDVAGSHRRRAHDVARPQGQRHPSVPRARVRQRDLETTKAHDLRAWIDAQNPYHRHGAECKVCVVKIAMLLLAAGRGSRFGGPVPKAYLKLAGRTLLANSAQRLVQAVATTATVELIVLVHPDDRATHLADCMADLRTLVAHSAALRIVDGGATRQESMQRGLAACSRDIDFVLVHDAARALVPIAATRACLLAAQRHGAALLAIPAPDTLKRVVGDRVETTVDRTGIWQAQTPQIVRRELLQRAFDNALATGFQGTDDVSLVEHLGEPVVVVPGSPTNVKITRKEDLPLAEAILAAELA